MKACLKIKNIAVLTVTVLAIIFVFMTGCGSSSSSMSAVSITSAQSSELLSPDITDVPSTVNETLPEVLTTTTAAIATISTADLPVQSAQEIASGTLTSTAKMEYFRFDMDFTMSFDIPSEEHSQAMTMQQVATGSINIPDKEMVMIMDMVMEIPDDVEQSVTGEIYIKDGWLYVKAFAADIGEQWSKMKLTDEMWAQQSQITAMPDFLSSPVNLALAGSESINGIDCYVIDIIPDMQSLSDWMGGQMQSDSANVNLDELNVFEMFEEFTVREWIAKDGFLPVRQKIYIKSNMDSGEADVTGFNNRMALDMDLTYYDHGKISTIQLPPEALHAVEIVQPE